MEIELFKWYKNKAREDLLVVFLYKRFDNNSYSFVKEEGDSHYKAIGISTMSTSILFWKEASPKEIRLLATQNDGLQLKIFIKACLEGKFNV